MAVGPGLPSVQAHVRVVPRLVEACAFLTVVVVPLAFTPFSWAPFVDAKLAVLVAAALALAVRRETYQSPFLAPAAIWILSVVAATALSADVWQSILGRENQGSGLALAVCCAVLLMAGSRLPAALRDRVPVWLVGAGVAAAVIGIVLRLSPGIVRAVFGRSLGLEAAGLPPLGHPVFLGAFLGAALAAAVPIAKRRPVLATASVAVLASGISITGKRAVLCAAAAGLVFAMTRCRLPRARMALLGGTLLLVTGVWTALDAIVAPATPVAAGRRFGELTQGSALARPYVWSASARALSRRPVLGWGPGNTSGAIMSSATHREASVTGRVFEDAHNILVESAVTTGVVGAGGLFALLAIAVRRSRRAPPQLGWALGAALALAVHHLFQPLHLAVTPLFFFVLGVAASAHVEPTKGSRGRPHRRAARWAFSGLLVAALPLAALRLGASTMEAQGRKYFSRTHGELLASLRLEPRRLSAASYLVRQQAVDARGVPGAERRVRARAERLVREHLWDLSSRLVAADVEMLLGHPEGAARWIEEHLKVFPHDALALAFRAYAALRMGEPIEADRWIAESLALEPLGPAKRLKEGRVPADGGFRGGAT